MVVRYEDAFEERDALRAPALNPLTMDGNVVPIAHEFSEDRARGARDDDEAEGEVLDLPPLTNGNEEGAPGGDSNSQRNGSLEEDDYQHPHE